MARPLVKPDAGWRRPRLAPSLAEAYRSVPVDARTWWRRALAFAGPGYLVAVGYMDPGNWATDLAGGSAFGYTLLKIGRASCRERRESAVAAVAMKRAV